MRARTLISAAVGVVLAASLTACGGIASSSSSAGFSGSSGGGSTGGSTSGGTTGGASAPPISPIGGDNTCLGRFFPPPTGIVPGASVKGTLQTLCAQPPRRHDLTMELQRLVNGTWQNQNTKTINTIPEATVRFNLITAACIPGSWRLHIRINIVSPTGITQVVDKTGDVQEVKPSDCG